jgi:flagellar biosynthetic protein FliR
MGALPASHIVFAALLLFCRIGACLMIAPGIGNSQIPAQVRLFVVVGATLALTPMLLDRVEAHADGQDPIGMTKLIAMELLVGGLIGVLARLFFSALETLAFAAATMLGLSNPFGVEVDQNQPLPPLANLLTLGATAMIFVADFHWQIIIGLIDSYRVLPFGAAFDARRGIAEIGDVLAQSFLIAARIASPFFLYSVIVNFAMALINRVTPAIAVFFIAPPFIVSGGLALVYFTIRGQIGEFMAAFSGWLGSG